MKLDKIWVQQLLGVTVNPNTKGAVNIIDVSGYTGKITHAELEPYVSGEKEPRLDGAIFRLTDGALTDTWAEHNFNGFKSLGLPIGGYGVHYVRESATSNKRQAQALANLVMDLGGPNEFPLKVYGDWEKNPDNLGISLVRAGIWKYIYSYEEIVNEIINAYTNYWWTKNVANPTNGNTDIPKGRDGWFASWYADKPYIPYDWSHRYGNNCWVLWQYENRFRFPGVPGSVDMSTFNGTMDQFRQYYGLVTPPPPPPPDPLPDPIQPIARMQVTNCQWLNVRAQPSLGAADLGDLVEDSIVPVVEKYQDWYRISGWVHKDYLDPV